MYRMQSGGWPYSEDGRDSLKAPSLRVSFFVQLSFVRCVVCTCEWVCTTYTHCACVCVHVDVCIYMCTTYTHTMLLCTWRGDRRVTMVECPLPPPLSPSPSPPAPGPLLLLPQAGRVKENCLLPWRGKNEGGG